MNTHKVVEKENEFAVHLLTYSYERAQYWIDTMGDSGLFIDKTLTKDSLKLLKFN
jgi:hypothetical protein